MRYSSEEENGSTDRSKRRCAQVPDPSANLAVQVCRLLEKDFVEARLGSCVADTGDRFCETGDRESSIRPEENVHRAALPAQDSRMTSCSSKGMRSLAICTASQRTLCCESQSILVPG